MQANSVETELMCHTQQLLKNKYGDALVFQPTANGPSESELLCGGLDGSCIMDPHPDLPYLVGSVAQLFTRPPPFPPATC
jgi:hypothetical protein